MWPLVESSNFLTLGKKAAVYFTVAPAKWSGFGIIPLKAALSAAVTTLSAIQMAVSTPLISVPLGVVTPVVPFTDSGMLLDSHIVSNVPSYLESVALLANA